MQPPRPCKIYGAGPVLRLPGKSIHLLCKMREGDQKKDRIYKVHIHINEHAANIDKHWHCSENVCSEMLHNVEHYYMDVKRGQYVRT